MPAKAAVQGVQLGCAGLRRPRRWLDAQRAVCPGECPRECQSAHGAPMIARRVRDSSQAFGRCCYWASASIACGMHLAGGHRSWRELPMAGPSKILPSGSRRCAPSSSQCGPPGTRLCKVTGRLSSALSLGLGCGCELAQLRPRLRRVTQPSWRCSGDGSTLPRRACCSGRWCC